MCGAELRRRYSYARHVPDGAGHLDLTSGRVGVGMKRRPSEVVSGGGHDRGQAEDAYDLGTFLLEPLRRAKAEVHVGRLGAQGAGGCLILGDVDKGVEGEDARRVLVGDLCDVLWRQSVELRRQGLWPQRPGRVRVRVIAFPGDHVDVELVATLEAVGVGDEARDDVLEEHLAGELVTKVLVSPGAVLGINAVDPLEEIGNPADAAFAEGDSERWVLSQHG